MIYVQLSSYELYIYVNSAALAGFQSQFRKLSRKKALNSINSIYSKHSHKKWKDILKTRSVMLIFLLEIKISGVAIKKTLQTSKNGYLHCFSKESFSENNFETVLANFYCYKYDANASEEVEKIAIY